MATNVDEAKLFAMAVLGGGSFVVGLLPGTINRRFHDTNPLFMSFLLCLGAGVLIATSIVHILTEVQEAIPGSAAIYFCLGFFIMYFVDVVFHALFDSHGHDSLEPSQSNSYGSMESERESLLGPGSPPSDAVVAPCPNNNASSKFGLLCALSLHSFLEGLAIGVQDTSAKVLLLITAVACHKYVVGFSLGLEFTSGHGTRRQMWRQLLISMMIFAVGSVLGIALGMALVDLKDLWSSNTIPILQAIAGGTLLYVTLSEVLPREKNKHRSRKAIVLQFVACLLGFTLMAILNSYLVEPETESR